MPNITHKQYKAALKERERLQAYINHLDTIIRAYIHDCFVASRPTKSNKKNQRKDDKG